MKRFTATEKWDDSWFRKLSPELKCFWEYIRDRCDAAGVWKVDLEAAEFYIGAKLDPDTLAVAFGTRIRTLSEGKWWITRFIEFQYGRLSRECKPHVPIFKLLEHHGISLESLGSAFVESNSEPQKPPTLSVPLANPSGRVQEKDKDKDKEKDKEKEEDKDQVPDAREAPPNPENPHNLSPLGLRISGWFSRRPSTRWSDREIRELRKVEGLKTPDDDLLLLEQRYLSSAPFIRKEILTLLNNWNGEIDRCRSQTNGHSAGDAPKSTWELNKIMEAKQKLAKELENRWTHEAPTGLEWNDPQKKQMWRDLQKEIKDLNNQIANPK